MYAIQFIHSILFHFQQQSGEPLHQYNRITPQEQHLVDL